MYHQLLLICHRHCHQSIRWLQWGTLRMEIPFKSCPQLKLIVSSISEDTDCAVPVSRVQLHLYLFPADQLWWKHADGTLRFSQDGRLSFSSRPSSSLASITQHQVCVCVCRLECLCVHVWTPWDDLGTDHIISRKSEGTYKTNTFRAHLGILPHRLIYTQMKWGLTQHLSLLSNDCTWGLWP